MTSRLSWICSLQASSSLYWIDRSLSAKPHRHRADSKAVNKWARSPLKSARRMKRRVPWFEITLVVVYLSATFYAAFSDGYNPLWLLVCIPIFALARYDLILPLRVLAIVTGVLQVSTAVLLYWLVRR